MYNRHPRLPQALNDCETDAAFELADPEEELELKLAGVKALNETVCSELCGWLVQFEFRIKLECSHSNIFLSLRYGKTLKRHRGNKKRLLRQRKGKGFASAHLRQGTRS